MLFDILVVLVAAKLAAEVAERLGVPAVVGEIVAGVLVGPSVLHLVGHGDEVLRTLGELGVILLLLEVGLQMDLGELAAVGRASLTTATIGVVTPLVLGLGAMELVGDDAKTSLFVAAALTATSVGITARVFGDMRALATTEARIVLGAAVADDVMGLVVLTVVVRLVTGGSVTVWGVAGIVAVALLFLLLGGLVAVRVAPPFFARVEAVSRSTGTMVALALAFTLAFAELADAAKLAPIVGAFVAGLALARTGQATRIGRELAPVGHLLIPVFFLQIGIDADVGAFFHPAVLRDAGVLLVVAVVGKLVSAWGAAGTPADKLLVGLGMLPRGEVGLIFATIGLQAGVLDQHLYAALLLVVLATTLLTPPLLKLRSGRLTASGAAVAAAVGGPARLPPPASLPAGAGLVGANLQVVDGQIVLAGAPSAHLALRVALRAAVLAADARPSAGLLDWLTSASAARRRLERTDVPFLFEVLEAGNARSWRFLETTGVLAAALPEVAETLRLRHADPFELDPAAAHRWPVLERLRASLSCPSPPVGGLAHPERLLLAGLLDEAFEARPDRAGRARAVLRRLDLGAAAEEWVTALVGDRDLLWAAARRSDGLGEDAVLDLAARLGDPDRARAQLLLALATAPEAETWQRQRLLELYGLIEHGLSRPDLTGLAAGNRLNRIRAETTRLLGEEAEAVARLRAAPRWYVLAADPAAAARQVRLVVAAQRREAVEVAVGTDASDRSTVDVDVAGSGRDLLPAVVAALDEAAGTLRRLTFVTWPDGRSLVSCRLVADRVPERTWWRAAVAARRDRRPLGRDRPLVRRAEGPMDIDLDDGASPWWTVCTARWPAGIQGLPALVTALAGSDVRIHAALVHAATDVCTDAGAGEAGVVTARLELTDGHGQKLTARAGAALRSAVGAPMPVRARWRRPRRLTLAASGPT